MRLFWVLVFCFQWLLLQAQAIWMTPNQGQWGDTIAFLVPVNEGKVYVGNKGLNYFMYNLPDHEEKTDSNQSKIKIHSIFQRFLNNENVPAEFYGTPSSHYSSFFVGKDTSHWRSKIHDFQKVRFNGYYPNIDLYYTTEGEQLSYGFKIFPGGSPGLIGFTFEGCDEVKLQSSGDLLLTHRFGTISQSRPKAWYFKEGQKKEIAVSFRRKDSHWGFAFEDLPSVFDSLVIDPSLTFSSFSGSTADNWGFTATPDLAGNVFGAGIVFGSGYPTTPGSYDISFNNGVGALPFDVGVSKFNPGGSNLLYSLYFGGSGNETPHSIVTSSNGELYVYGVTCSPNFPTTTGAFDATFNGGPSEIENSLTFNGSDVFIARFNSTGTSLLASTYVGGTGTDGLNVNTLHYNYGDQFRGEIILDANGNIYISSTTSSMNFPITAGVYSTVLNGLQDAVVCKFNNTLTTMLWGSFFGGIGEESGNSIEISPNGSVYLSGGSTSPSFPSVTSGNDLSNNGGLSDGYIARFNPNNGTIVSATFMGANEYDQAYFVRCDPGNNVYVYGQTESNWAISPGCIGTPNSGQYIRKYDGGLQNIQWSTVFGAGSGHVEISPTAFLVSDCNEIYVSGWGGQLNANSGVSQALFSTTNGFPITPNAYQSNTNGSNFYLAVFSADAQALNYGTYMGGVASSSNHVDGGTSRFDKKGRIYHAVCGACGGNNFGFTSTPGSWSPQNQSSNCNMAVFKFDLSLLDAVLAVPSPLICLPQPVLFNNNSINGNTYEWDFGDGTQSNQFEPSHVYPGAGNYTVTLIVSDSNNCYSPDTASILVSIGDFQGGATIPSLPICPGSSYQLNAFGGSTYSWSPANVLDDATLSNPTATVFTNTIFTVIISDSCGSDTIQVPLNVVPTSVTASNDTSICIGNSVNLNAQGNGTVTWSPSTYLNTTQGNVVTATPDTTTMYIATLTTAEGCISTDTVWVYVYFTPPSSNLPDTVILCEGTSTTLTAAGANSYLWSPNVYISTTVGPTVTVNPPQSLYYYCAFTNACGTLIDSVFINVLTANVTAQGDTIICPGGEAFLSAYGGITYQWTPNASVVNQTANFVWVKPLVSTLYQVVGTDINGCKDTAFVEVVLHPWPSITISPNIQAFYGDQIQLNAVGNSPGSYVWSPGEYLSCINCPNPVANPDQDITYTISFTDENGCNTDANVSITYEAVIYIPNSFIPDGNGRNDLFGVFGGNISSMELLLFDRWGELIYTLHSLDDRWDGTYEGNKCPDGVYTWKLIYTDTQFKKNELTGHVVLLR